MDKHHERLGCPDWRDERAFDKANSWGSSRWQWEFKRRLWNVRLAFHTHVINILRKKNPVEAIPDQFLFLPEFRETSFLLSSSYAADIGYSRLFNPMFGERPLIHEVSFGPEENTPFDARAILPFHLSKVWDRKWDPIDILKPIQLAIVFAPNAPLGPQLKGLRKYLESKQHHSVKHIQRPQKAKWVRYLRIIDAREQGASWCRMHSNTEGREHAGNSTDST